MNLDLSPDYFEHPKTLNLIAELGPGAEVYPIRLWCWAMKFAKSGTIPGGEKMVALACNWSEEPEKLVSALMSIPEGFKHGFLNPGFKIHNWMDRTGGALKAYENKKKKQRAKRLRAISGKNSGTIPAPRPALPSPSPPDPAMPIPSPTETQHPENVGGNSDQIKRFDAAIWEMYPPQRRPNKVRMTALRIFVQELGGTEYEAQRIKTWILHREKSKDWKDGVIPNLDRFLRELPKGLPGNNKNKRIITDTRPKDKSLWCSDCDGYGRGENGKCGKCAGTGVDNSKIVKPETVKEETGHLFKSLEKSGDETEQSW